MKKSIFINKFIDSIQNEMKSLKGYVCSIKEAKKKISDWLFEQGYLNEIPKLNENKKRQLKQRIFMD